MISSTTVGPCTRLHYPGTMDDYHVIWAVLFLAVVRNFLQEYQQEWLDAPYTSHVIVIRRSANTSSSPEGKPRDEQ